jgi:hypothetical protein
MSSIDSDSSSSEDVSAKIDDLGRPLTRPVYGAIGESSVLARVKDFLPQLRASNANVIDPRVDRAQDSDIILTRVRSPSISSESSTSSGVSFGVEVDVGLGVFDVNGVVDEAAFVQGNIPIVYSNVEGHAGQKGGDAGPLIQEVEEI